jgi:23S rRNA (adenine2503-C2)-methyltransferase
VDQILLIQADQKQTPTNLLFMGMGEPLQNTDAVLAACRIFIDQDGMNFSKRKVTVSTSGIVPEIDRLGAELDVSLAISLNGSSNAGREAVMPINRKWPLEDLIAACKRYPLGPHRKITFEYVMMAGVNDSLEDARRLVKLMKGLRCLVNLIPLNEHPGAAFHRPSDETVTAFSKVLLEAGIRTTVRISRGQDILAACGQLARTKGTRVLFCGSAQQK